MVLLIFLRFMLLVLHFCRFVLHHKSLAVPVLKICVEALGWSDSESMSKVSTFCGLVVLLAVSTNNVELRQFVCKDLFSAIIQGLTLESNAFISADLVGLCREIFVYLSNRDPSPRQVGRIYSIVVLDYYM